MALQIGKLRHRLELRSNSTSQNSYGEATDSYSTYTTVWGQVAPLSGRELQYAQQISAEITHKIIVRYNSSLTSDDRIKWGSRIFDILSVLNPEEINEYLELKCKEIK